MATSKGATMHQHSDIKVQQEFERVGRATSKISETIAYQQNNGGNRGISKPAEPTLWALTIEKNGVVQLVNSDKKIVQVLNFQEVPKVYSAKPISCLVKWNIEKQIPPTDLLTIPNGIGMDIKAVAELDKRDLSEWLDSVIYYYLNTVTDKLYKVLVSSTDEEANYLENKITASGFSEVEINTDVDGIQTLNINSEADIGDLNDVVITDIQDGDVLAYDEETQNWINTNILIPKQIMFSEESTLWEVNHYRGYRPIVDITDLEGNEIEVDVNHLNDGQFVVTPADATTGIVTYY